MSVGRFVSRWFETRSSNLAGAVYGTILVTSVIAASSSGEGLALGLLTVSVLVTVLVFSSVRRRFGSPSGAVWRRSSPGASRTRAAKDSDRPEPCSRSPSTPGSALLEAIVSH